MNFDILQQLLIDVPLSLETEKSFCQKIIILIKRNRTTTVQYFFQQEDGKTYL